MTNQGFPPPPPDPYTPPTAPHQEPPRHFQPLVLSSGPRIAGGLLIVNAVLVLAEMALFPDDPALARFSSPAFRIGSAIFDVCIGVGLLANVRALVPVTIARVTLGLVVFTAISAMTNPFAAVMQLVLSISILLLLVGQPGKPRIAVACSLFGLNALVGLIGISATVTGRNPIASLILRARDDIETTPVREVTGIESHYHLRFPSDRWHLRKPEAAKKDNALSDRWITRPDLDAHVLVIDERVKGGLVGVDPLTDAVIKNAQSAATQYELVSRSPLRTNAEQGRFVHSRSTVSKLELESYTGVVGTYEHGYQIMAFAPRKAFPVVEGELRSIVESFELPTDEKPSMPEGAEPLASLRIAGNTGRYVLTAPSNRWFLRTAEAAKKDNALADRWIMRPDKDAHILVIAEEVEEGEVKIDLYRDAIVSNLKSSASDAVVISSEPIAGKPESMLVHVMAATPGGLAIEYYYGLFTRGKRAFQVVTFAAKGMSDEVRQELIKACETFEISN